MFGIVSTSPGFEMNAAAGDNSTHPFVALAGRVPCKVTGRVSKGDRLVSSNVPGHAIRSNSGNDCRWTHVVGRALENKTTEDEGVIEVVVGAK